MIARQIPTRLLKVLWWLPVRATLDPQARSFRAFNASLASTNKARVKQLAWSVLGMLKGEPKLRRQGVRLQMLVPSCVQLARLV